MLYFENAGDAEIVKIPKDGNAVSGAMSLRLISTVDHTSQTVSVTDLGGSDIYVTVGVSLPEGMADGEYEYALTCGTVEVSRGIAILGMTPGTVTQYEKNITYKQYGE